MNWLAACCLLIPLADHERPIDFSTEIIPVLTKAGCNAGACHGAAAGRGGFHLSLLGADPAADYESIKLAFEGRRINRAHPESSLLLAKPTGRLDHGGGAPLDEESPGAARILAWIRAGAPRGGTRRLTSLKVEPSQTVRAEYPARQQLAATAHFDQGPAEDVTSWTVFSPADPAGIEIEAGHIARIKRRGQHVIVARFLDRVVPIQINVPYSNRVVDLTNAPRSNFIDDEVLRVLADLNLPVSPPATDEVFLRRVTLDLTGRLPTPASLESYLADPSPQKRERLVDALLASDAFVDYWTLRLARWLRLHSLPNEREGVQAYESWLRRQIAEKQGFDVVARELLTATGDSHVVGPANFARMVPDARGHAELVGRFFLGMRLGCANCHNHPLDRWTQDDYHGLAAIFARLERGREVRWAARGAVTNLRTNEPAVPRLPGTRDLAPDGDHRARLADWVLADDRRYFARSLVNRLWQAMFGRGLVEPVDDLRATNPATHPELLDRLADDFLQNGYRLERPLRRIALSETYGRAGTPLSENVVEDRFYARAYRRPLPPEVLADAIAHVTGVTDEYPGMPPGSPAVTLVDPLRPALSLDILGRCNRVAGCDDDVSADRGLPTQLHLLNGTLINAKLSSEEGRLAQRIAAGATDQEMIDEFFRRGLGRAPTSSEAEWWAERVQSDDRRERRHRLEDFVWSLLNSRDFQENH